MNHLVSALIGLGIFLALLNLAIAIQEITREQPLSYHLNPPPEAASPN